jgi:signal transduction histidine kinase
MPDYLGLIALLLGGIAVYVSFRRVRQARQREEAARNEAEEARSIKNDFVAMVSHELRTPLTSIAGYADILVASWSTLASEEVDEFLRYISTQSRYLGELVEDILVIPRLEAGRLTLKPEVFDLGSLTHSIANFLFPPGGGREAIVSLPVGVRMNADPRRVQQIIRNLLENARKYGGDQVAVDAFTHGEQYVLVVTDNGTGVPDISVQKIFEHFEQLSKGDARSSSGIGLGLPIARRLARAMGGDVWYERRFPRGSRFCFALPVRTLILEEPAKPAVEEATTEGEVPSSPSLSGGEVGS